MDIRNRFPDWQELSPCPTLLPIMDFSDPTSELQHRLGDQQVRTDQPTRYRASMDNLRYSVLPDAVLFPADEEAVATILHLANQHHVPVTPRGAGSATTGTTTPVQQGWVLDLSQWTNLHIDPLARMAYVQPGVPVSTIDHAAAQHQLRYPPDPGNARFATIGGTLATNAGGLRGAKYGVTRDYVHSLEGFLPTGEFVRWGANLRKFSAGFNIRDLWVGSEGALGIITGAVLRLIPRAPACHTALAVFPDHAAALRTVHQILLSSLEPAAVEFLDAQTVACTFALWQNKDPELLQSLPACLRQFLDQPEAPAVLLLELDGDARSLPEQADQLNDLLATHAAAFDTADSPDATESLWKIRRSCSQAMFQLGNRKLNEDVVVPFDQQIPLLDFLQKLRADFALPTPTFGHAADGNFHTHILYHDEDPQECRRAAKAVDALMHKVIDLGGAISGEHGIGLAKSNYLRLQYQPAEIQTMQRIKDALDPNNILNPGKLFTPTNPLDLPRESVRLPWDH